MVIAGFNLASSDFRRSRRRVVFAVATGAILVVVLAIQLAVWSAQRREAQVVEARLSEMEGALHRHQEEARAVRARIPAETVKQYEAKVAAYNQILEASAFSWIGLLVELERSVPPGVTLSEIRPDLASGKVALRGEARTFEDLTKLLNGLEQRTGFRDVFLLRQAARKSAGGEPEVLEFSVNLISQRPSP
jgi:hypothetical protein